MHKDILWTPSKKQIDSSNLSNFIKAINQKGHNFQNYVDLYNYSITHIEDFWSFCWDYFDIIGEKGDEILQKKEDFLNSSWFREAKLNYAQNLLQNAKNNKNTLIYYQCEDKIKREISGSDLYDQVSKLQQLFSKLHINSSAIIAGYLPNCPETITSMLATSSIGATWTSMSPDFGVDSVIERISQVNPEVLISYDGYYYNGKEFELIDKIDEIVKKVPSIKHIIIYNQINKQHKYIKWDSIDELPSKDINFKQQSFNDPLYIMYSSGTTGKPKCIVHGVGGTLIQHLKEHQLHCDIKPKDKVFYFTTCGWMMWNWLVSALASNASVVLYDGSPGYPNMNVLWEMSDTLGVKLFGTSAKYIDTMNKNNIHPKDKYNLKNLQTILSTGSVLSPESFDFVYTHIKKDLNLASISGGTDIISCFMLGCPIKPVYRGYSQVKGLGMAIEVFDENGTKIINQKGELVCTKPFPSKPIYFFNDPNKEKYFQAYFSKFPNTWTHGDYIKENEKGIKVYGRSDTTLNPGGVRIGTAEIYRYAQNIPEIINCAAIGQEWDNDVRIVLFVVLKDGIKIDDTLKESIKQIIRTNCTPRHIPSKIIQVSDIPVTKSGKISEISIKNTVHNENVNNFNALANPESLKEFKNLEELR